MIAILLLLAGALFAAAEEMEQAELLRTSGSLSQAREIYERLIPSLRKAGDTGKLGLALQHLSEIDLAEAKYTAAVTRSSECATILHGLGNATGEVSCQSVAGRAHLALGDFAAAMDTYRLSLATAKAKGLSEAEVAMLNNIGNVHYFLGRYYDALLDYEEAGKVLASHPSEQWFTRRRILTVSNEATLYQRLGQYSKALTLYMLLRNTSQSLRGSERTQMLVNMGTLYRRLGDPVKALEMYRTAQESMAQASDPASQISIAKNAGIALAFDLGKLPEALGRFQEALEVARKSGNRREDVQAMLYRGEIRLRTKQWTLAKDSFAGALLTARELGVVEDEWKCLYGLGRVAEAQADDEAALSLYRGAIRVIEGVRAGAGAPAMRVNFLADKRDVYDAAIRVLLRRAQPPVRDLFRLIEQIKARSFQDRVPSLADGPDLDRVSANLAPGVTMLDYWISESQIAVVWIQHSGTGIVQGPAPSDADLEALGKELAEGKGDRWRQLAAAISPKVLPLPLDGATSLIIVPDGPLQLLPFDILSAPGSADRILLEKASISYTPAAAFSTNKKTATPDWIPPWRLTFAGFADPTVGSQAANGSMFASDAASLPGAAAEVRAAAAALAGRATLHTGPDDLKRYLMDGRYRDVPVLHLATHAVADSDDAERSRILFSPAYAGSSADYLFAREIYRLDLKGVDLAMLSACDTERGTSVRGEGVQSFSRALLAAGAASVITTLWKVGDRASSQFCERFYSHLAEHDTVSQALRKAKLEFYRSHSAAQHPRYWSVFALNGAPETRTPRGIPWAGVAAAAAMILAAILWWKTRSRTN